MDTDLQTTHRLCLDHLLVKIETKRMITNQGDDVMKMTSPDADVGTTTSHLHHGARME